MDAFFVLPEFVRLVVSMSRKQKRLERLAARKEYLEHKSADPNDLHFAIATLVRTLEFADCRGGICYFRSLTGSIVLDRFGIDHKIVLGSLLYRAGRKPWDILMFAGEDNRGHHPGLFHSWIETDTDLIDFSPGDWERVVRTDRDLEINPASLPPITWIARPPEFIWSTRAPLVNAWEPAPYGPSLGCTWYGPIAEHNQEMLDEERVKVLPKLNDAIDRVFLKFGLPVFKVFDSLEERATYIKENNLT